MAALDNDQQRPHGWVHDWFPIFVLVVVCVLVYAFDVHV